MTISDIIQNTLSLVPKHKREIQFVSISSAIVLALSCIVYDFFLLPPRNIRHLPHWKYSDFIKKVLFKRANFEENINHFKKKNQSFHGLNLRPDRVGWVVHVSSPSGVKTVLSKPDIFPKAANGIGSQGTVYNKFIGGSNLLLSDGDEYKKHRKAASPAFHRSMPVQLFGRMTQTMFQEIDCLQGENVNMTDLCERLTLDILGRAVFDFDFNSTGNPKNEWAIVYQSIMEAMNQRLFYFLPFLDQNNWLLLFPKRRQAHQQLAKFLGMLSDMIISKRKIIEGGNSNINDGETDKVESDLLSLMIESEAHNDKTSLTNDEIRSNLCIFFFAGHETTSNAFAFAIYNLAKNQPVQEKARQEAIRQLGDSPEDIIPTLKDAIKLTYINQIMKETMRMFGPVVDTAPRITNEDTYIDGAFIPKDTYVTANLFSLHHNEKVWKSPSEFIPERFESGGEADQLFEEGVNWAPFGGGKRQCIGMNFSLSEQRVMISMLLRKYIWTLPDDSIHKDNAVTSGIISISPVNLRINFKRRY